MELGTQIKKLRNECSMSQDELAQRVYVSRQTISNWENDKSYPDVNSLVLLSEVFDTSIDTLIKGDVEIMKEQVNEQDRVEFNQLSQIFGIMFLIAVIIPIPLAHFLGFIGVAIYVVYMGITMYVAILVEKKKKALDIQTYREIIAFSEGKNLDEISKAREEGKRPYQKVLLAICSGAIAFIVAMIFVAIFGL